MSSKSDIFWTDVDQARERLLSSVILYDNQPVFVMDIVQGDESDRDVRALLFNCDDKERKTYRKKLNSPKFKRFRELPTLGWVNLHSRGTAVYVQRRVVATRTHGLAENNTLGYMSTYTEDLFHPANPNNVLPWNEVYRDKGFTQGQQGEFPSLASILEVIKLKTVMAYSRRFAVGRDLSGLRWLICDKNKVGIFVGNNTLLLLDKFFFLRETLMEDKAFTLDRIQEY